MAFSVRLTGLDHDGREMLSVEPSWWEVSQLFETCSLRWTRTNETGSYTDDIADATIDEARIIHAQFRDRLLKDIEFNSESLASYAKGNSMHKKSIVSDYRKHVSKLKSQLQELDTAMANVSGKFAKFRICVFEWESGL